MELSKEQIAKVKEAKSAEELLTMAKESGVRITADKAKETFDAWHKEGELTDDELDSVSGGACGSSEPPEPLFHKGDWISEYELYFYKILSVTWNGADYDYYCLIVQEFPNDGTRGAGYVTRSESQFMGYSIVNYEHADEFADEI